MWLKEFDYYTLLSQRLYRQGSDQVLRFCLGLEDYKEAIAKSHVSLVEIHASKQQTMQIII